MKINDNFTKIKLPPNFSDIEKISSKDKTSVGFTETLKEKLQVVNEKQIEAENITDRFIKGENVAVHEVMIKTEEAKLSLQLAVQIRNKLVEAYQELNRMQL